MSPFATVSQVLSPACSGWGRGNVRVSGLSSERSLSTASNRQDGGSMADKSQFRLRPFPRPVIHRLH